MFSASHHAALVIMFPSFLSCFLERNFWATCREAIMAAEDFVSQPLSLTVTLPFLNADDFSCVLIKLHSRRFLFCLQ